MTTEEHLKKIKAKCESLLAIAEKRTPGKWDTLGVTDSNSLRLFAGNRYLGMLGNSDADKLEVQADSTFIASCAGSAEAGWRATIAAIDALLELYDQPNEQVAHDIIAAWPEELL